MRLVYLSCASALLCFVAYGQVSSNQSLKGKYNFRHMLLSADASANVTDVRTGSGTLTFDGNGGYTCSGTLLVNAAVMPLSVTGAYTVSPGGYVTLDNPVKTGKLNARLGATGIVGASTESSGMFDLFIATPAATQPVSASILSGSYWISTLELQGGGISNLREANFKLTANNAGSFTQTTITGQARNLGDQLLTQTVSPMTYSVTSDGLGMLNFPLTGSLDQTTQLVSGTKEIFISPDGSFFVGGSNNVGGQGMIVGMKTFGSGAAWIGFFVGAGFRFTIFLPRTLLTSAGW